MILCINCMTYPKLINKDLKNNSFEYDGGDLWVREDVSFWDDQEVCWNNDILKCIREISYIKKLLCNINYTIPYGRQIDSLMPNQEYNVGLDNRFFSKIADIRSTNLDIISNVSSLFKIHSADYIPRIKSYIYSQWQRRWDRLIGN